MDPEGSTAEETPCQHHWIMETATGPTIKGVCLRCGMEKEFPNSGEAATWARGVGEVPDHATIVNLLPIIKHKPSSVPPEGAEYLNGLSGGV